MTKIRLIDVDSKIPNLALMQLSAYHKSLGDEVGFDVSNPDKVYISCVFSKNREEARGIGTLFPGAEISIGGTGIDPSIQIPEAAQMMMPDYALYPCDFSIGFTTRGCIRACPFCIVSAKEGRIHKHMPIKDFWDPKHKTVLCLDNNMYALQDWFFEQTDFILEHNLLLDVTQGFDLRILTDEIAERLRDLNMQRYRFAWDNIEDEAKILDSLEILRNHDIDLRHRTNVYVLTGYNTTIEQDIYRCEKLREMGVGAFVMQYEKTKETKLLAHWANRKPLYWSTPFSEYAPYKARLDLSQETTL